MIRFFTFLFSLSTLIAANVFAQTQKDTIYTYYTKTPVVIDGSDADACWATAKWNPINQVWLGGAMKEGDFSGKFKTAWDKNYLYVLVQVEDDSLSDDHKDPLDNYWNDDAVELFIDEDRSGGNHQYNNSAFAYHCSIFYDVIDGAGKNGATINCKNNINMRMDTIGPHLYLWEFAIKMFNKNFDYSNPEASRVYLIPNKLMGFSIAYCDNDGASDKLRENFIGSVVMPAGHENESYINADYFGTMLLVDPGNEWLSTSELSSQDKQFSVYPNPASDKISFNVSESLNLEAKVEIINSVGSIIRVVKMISQKQTIDLSGLTNGLYLVRVTNGSYSATEMIRKQ